MLEIDGVVITILLPIFLSGPWANKPVVNLIFFISLSTVRCLQYDEINKYCQKGILNQSQTLKKQVSQSDSIYCCRLVLKNAKEN